MYGGMADPLPMMTLFDKGLTLRMGQCHVKRWTDELLDIAQRPGDELGLESLATHRLPLSEAPQAYRMFQQKTDGCLKVVLTPESGSARGRECGRSARPHPHRRSKLSKPHRWSRLSRPHTPQLTVA